MPKKHMTKKQRKRLLRINLICILVLLAAIAAAFFILKALSGADDKPPAVAPAATPEPRAVVETAFLPVQFPLTYSENLHHEQETEGGIVRDIFYLVQGDVKLELFRISYGDASAGEYYGLLDADGGAIPVTYQVSSYAAEDLMDSDVTDLYRGMMDGFSVVLDSVGADSRFNRGAVIADSEIGSVSLRYWSVELPAGMTWTETEDAGNYRAEFYGTVAGEQIPLYTVELTDAETGSVIGKYRIGDAEKFVCINSSEFVRRDHWTEADLLIAGTMMETVNDLVQTIMASPDFFVPVTEEPSVG